MSSRQTEHGANVARPMPEACVGACRSCGGECATHAEHMEHCAVCAASCRRCEAACRTPLQAIAA